MIPDLETCFSLLRDYRVPVHIVGHSVVVTKIAVVLGEALRVQGLDQDMSLLAAAGLLHDIAKLESITTGVDHALLGGQWLEALGFSEVAMVVRHHIHLEPAPWQPVDEKELVFYADKRVKHVEIVSLDHRFADLRDRYGKNVSSLGSLGNMEKLTRELEKKIFSPLSWRPDEVVTVVDASANGQRRLLDRIAALYEKYIDIHPEV
ncbi:MAG: HD domain-containing protein [Deltaproteobacteria bacterium]|nr:HD domain-containing protein [Candidatus Anaeroferrophillus wilburensis]MBN2890106.1 HD domain-containing protein [Deltaproteobacteria bacterium]